MQKLVENACIYTGLPDRTWAEALAIRGDRVVAVGERSHCVAALSGETEKIDAGGKLVLPAFNDTHTHFVIGSQSLLEVDLRTVRSCDEFRHKVKGHLELLGPEEWLIGGYYNDEYWPQDGLPDITWIDDLTGKRPAILYRHDLHQALCNSAALEIIGFHDDSLNPEGGTLGRFENGSLNGRVYEKAMTIARSHIPKPSKGHILKALSEGVRHAHSLGITAVTDMIDSVDVIDWYEMFCGSGGSGMQFELCAPLPQSRLMFERGYQQGQSFGDITIGPLKGFMDGSLGSRTAYMHEDYADQPGNSGYLLEMANPPAKMLAMIAEAASKGFSSAIHAIGTKAIESLLDIFEQVQKEVVTKGLSHRIEHAQHILDKDVPRFAANNVVASMQPAHLTDDGNVAEPALGKKLVHTSYRCKSLITAGTRVTFNTDWPVVPLNPIDGIAAAVTRVTSDGNNPDGWLPNEKTTVQEAVEAYTVSAADATGKEKICGKLHPGYYADMVILDKNIITCEQEAIQSARVEMTISHGEIVFQI